MGQRHPTARLRRPGQRRGALARRPWSATWTADLTSVHARWRPEWRVRQPRPVPERRRPDQRRHDRISRKARSSLSSRRRTRRGISGRRLPSLLASITRPRPGWTWRSTAAKSGATRTTSRFVVEPSRNGSRADRRRDLQAVPGGRGGGCSQGEQARRGHREPARPGPGARRVDGVAVEAGRGRQRGSATRVRSGDAAL